MEWFLYDRNLRHKRVNVSLIIVFACFFGDIYRIYFFANIDFGSISKLAYGWNKSEWT